jgi:phytoene desaturase
VARCVVIGGGVAGLSAAIHARLRGYDVTLLEQGDALGGKAAPVRRDGFTLDPGPSIIILTHIYQEVFRRAGCNPDDYLQFQRLDPFTRVLMDGLDGPLDLPADEEACIQALGRVAPQDEPGLRTLMATLASAAPYVDDTVFAHPIDKPYQLLHPKLARFALHFNPRLTYRQLVDEQIKSPLLRAFFYGFPSYSGQTYDSKAAGALLIPFYMLRHGVWYPKGGIHAIPAAFTRLAQELGVEIQLQAKVTGVATQGRRLTEVHIEGSTALKAEAVICAMDRYTFGPWLQRPEPQTPSYSYYTLHWGLKGERPEVEHHTLLIPNGFEEGFEELYQQRRPPSRPVIYLNNPGRVDPQSAPPGIGRKNPPACAKSPGKNSTASASGSMTATSSSSGSKTRATSSPPTAPGGARSTARMKRNACGACSLSARATRSSATSPTPAAPPSLGRVCLWSRSAENLLPMPCPRPSGLH